MKKNKPKGIILAGGLATRLMPITKVVSKQLLPIFDKPMIFYPLDILLKAKIRDIAIIVNPIYKEQFVKLLGDGRRYGCNIHYYNQKKPNGIAESYKICKNFINKSKSVLILGDNLFYGKDIPKFIINATNDKTGATIFGFKVNNPKDYGNVQLGNNNEVLDIVEKPKKVRSKYAVTGLYILDNTATEKVKTLKPSKRGELEITSLLKKYIKENELNLKILNNESAWVDTGRFNSLNDANNFIKTIQKKYGLMIGCLEETALKNKWININKVKKNLNEYKNSEYGKYLQKLIKKYV